MKIYIAAKYGKRFELRELADRLRSRGHEITSRWLDNGEETAMSAEAAALMDIDDVFSADVLFFLAEPAGSQNTGGGRYVEFGYALAMGKRIIAVQPGEPQLVTDGRYRSVECVFLAHPSVKLVATIGDAEWYINDGTF